MSAHFDRRRFLVLAATAASAASLARAAGDGGVIPPSAFAPQKIETPLDACARRARERGLPVLEMLDARSTESRGLAWAAVLDLASDATLAELALCELAFATSAQVRETWPKAQLDESDLPFGLLFLPRLDVPVVIRPNVRTPERSVLRDSKRTDEIALWLRDVHAQLRRVIAPDAETFERRARIVLGDDGGSRETCQALLARIGRKQIDWAPAGAQWNFGQSVTCGAGPCGTAMVGDGSRRFLSLYVARGAGRYR